jgi:hypothetical protein
MPPVYEYSNLWTILETGVRANILVPSMFVAIIGTRFSGRTTIESYLIARGFVPVRIIAQASDYEARVGDYGKVSYLRACRSFGLPTQLFFRYLQTINPTLSWMWMTGILTQPPTLTRTLVVTSQ